LRSGDIEVHLPDQRSKDAALNTISTPEYKILRQDYPVEIQGVPLRLLVASGEHADNNELIRAITTANKRAIPTLTINRIRWLHHPKTHDDRIKEGKTRGSLIVSLPTRAIQYEVTRKGLAIDSELFEARLYDYSIQIR
jgi:hypothetical protein